METNVDQEPMLANCTTSICVQDDENEKLQCSECTRHLHYRCTQLPAYQIHMFITKRHRKYVCKNCIQVPKELYEKLPSREKALSRINNTVLESKKLKEEVKKLKKDVEGCESIIQTQTETIKEKSSEIDKLKQELKTLKSINSVEENLRVKMEEIKASVKEAITNGLKQIDDMTNTASKTFADAVKTNESQQNTPVNLRTIIHQARTKEQAEERDKKSRAANIILHGVYERPNANELVLKHGDKVYTTQLFKDLNVNATIKDISRLGKETCGKDRPIKIVLNSIKEKEYIMQNLKRLKGKAEYTGLSVTEDLTPAERELMKTWSEKAKEKNQEEPTDSEFIWRVRGSPKSALYLKRLRKQNASQ